MLELNTIHQGDSLELMKQMDDESVDCIITSPPYWQKRDYQVEGQIGLEPDYHDYLTILIEIFTEAKRDSLAKRRDELQQKMTELARSNIPEEEMVLEYFQLHHNREQTITGIKVLDEIIKESEETK